MNIFTTMQPELVSIVVAGAVGVVAYLYQRAIQGLPTNLQKLFDELAQVATQAVEQTYAASNPGGALKKQAAMQTIAAMSHELGLKFNERHASAAIESAVYNMNLYQHYYQPAPTSSLDSSILPASGPTGVGVVTSTPEK